MFKVKLLNNIAERGIETFDRANYAVSANVEDPDALLVRSAQLRDAQFGGNLLCIARAGVGTDNIPSQRCTESGIVVFNTPGANSDAVKELVLCALLLSSRDILGGIGYVKSVAGQGGDVPKLVEAEKNSFTGPELAGKTLGVIGLGAVGAKIANDAARLGMEVFGYDPYISVDAAWGLRTNIQRAVDLPTLFRGSDYITIHVPYTDSTHHLINRDAIAQMKDGVRIINLARAELVNDDDIIAALAAGKVAKYVTDFPNAKTAGADGVIALPHLGASTPESEEKCAVMAAIQIADYLENGNIENSVNLPRVSMPRMPGEPRLTVFHKNIPEMIAKISSTVSAHGINIENMVSASARGSDVAYTVLDLSGAASEPELPQLKHNISALESVIRVRVLP
ncbi:MAG: 3-phosphoglycerate dehydrogenase [Oscillospiraceae bacterium]|jgi:D-3-phosphoglycerate dehydrogenase|nr:3-phosphoglycerate dehydrogenase [Oscillospiraceae bacterium]